MKFAKTALATLVAVTSVLLSASAMADMSNGLIKSKSTYVAVDVGTVSPVGQGAYTSPMMLRVAAGAELAAVPAISVEADFNHFTDSTFSSGSYTETITRNSFGASGIYTLPLQQGFSVFGKLGLSFAMMTDKDTAGLNISTSKTLMTYGIGAKYDVNSKYSVRAMWEDLGAAGNAFGLSQTALSIGGVMRF